MKTLDYRPTLDVRNVAQLPRGVGRRARFLICLVGHDGGLVAERWAEKLPPDADAARVALKMR